jgi:hypothetical protein
MLVLMKKILKKIFIVFLLFRYYPLEKGYSLSLNKLKSPSPMNDLCQLSLVKIGPVVLEKKIFKWPHPNFTFLWLSPLWRGPGPLFEQTWIPFTQGWFVPSLIELCPGVLEKFFLKLQFFLLFRDYLLLERGDPLHLNKLESPPPKDDLCQVWLKLVQWFWRRSRKCKSLQTDGKTDGRRTTDDQNSSLKLPAQVS